MTDIARTHAHYYLVHRDIKPGGCLVLHDDNGTVQYLFKDGSVLTDDGGERQVYVGDAHNMVAWLTMAVIKKQQQWWRYDPQHRTWRGSVEVHVPHEDVRPIVATDRSADDAVSGDDALAEIYVADGPGGHYLTVTIDTDHFISALASDDGPYESREAAIRTGRDVAITWFLDNGLPYDGEDQENGA
jgi:hypothetical protein